MDRGGSKSLGFLLLALAIALGGSAWCQPLPVCDDFETPIAELGTYPYPLDDENEWLTLLNGGKSWPYSAYLSDAVLPPSGEQSFRLDSMPWTRQMDYFRLADVPDKLSYQASVRVDPKLGWVGLVGFMASNGYYTGVWNHFRIDGGDHEVSFWGTEVVRVGDYTPGAWCTVRAELDFTNGTAALWLNSDEPVLENVPINPKEFDDPYVGHVVLNQWGVATDDCTDYPWVSFSNVVYFDDVEVWESSTTLEVDISITPGGNPNKVNLKSKGLLPVAVFGTESFDATEIDPATVTFAGAAVAVKGKRDKLMAHVCDIDGDGLLDMLLQFPVQELDPAQVQDGFAVLTGETYGGVAFEGTDVIVIVPRH
jgi:hypothetical protein